MFRVEQIMRILCIATHPDDETLGCGGTLLRHKQEGDELNWLLMTSATGVNFSDGDLEQQNKQIEAVSGAFGFMKVQQLNFPSSELDRVSESNIVKGIAEAAAEIQPDIVYVNHGGDIHSDHRIVFQCAMSALKPFKSGRALSRIYTMEIPSETDQSPATWDKPFIPTTYVEIGDFIDRKIDIFSLYVSEQQEYPMPREKSAICSLARVRGSTIGFEYAEAFALIREVR
jgi:N-acetylglucosamine malate deacetylase 1